MTEYHQLCDGKKTRELRVQLNKEKPFDSVVDVERAGTLAEVAASQEGSQK